MNELVKKIGMDKIAHFGVGGLICAICTLVFILQEGMVDWKAIFAPFIGSVVVYIVSYAKERAIDSEFNWWDIVAAMLGCLCVFIAVAIGLLFNHLSQ